MFKVLAVLLFDVYHWGEIRKQTMLPGFNGFTKGVGDKGTAIYTGTPHVLPFIV